MYLDEAWNVSEEGFPLQGELVEKRRFLLNYAVLASSGHNTQPWLFRLTGVEVELYADRTRGLPVVDPQDRALTLPYVIAFWAIFTGILKMVMDISLRREIENERLMALSGVLSVLFGLIPVALPGVGLLSLVWLVGIYALVFGFALILLSFRIQGDRQESSRVR